MKYRPLKLRDERFLLGLQLILSLLGAALAAAIAIDMSDSAAYLVRYTAKLLFLFCPPAAFGPAFPRTDMGHTQRPTFERRFAESGMRMRMCIVFMCSIIGSHAAVPLPIGLIALAIWAFFVVDAAWRILWVNGILLFLSPFIIARAVAVLRFPFEKHPIDAMLKRVLAENREPTPAECLEWQLYLQDRILAREPGSLGDEAAINKRIRLAVLTSQLKRETALSDAWVRRIRHAHSRRLEHSENSFQGKNHG